MDEVEGKTAKETAAKRQAVLKRWLSDDDDETGPSGFADPAMFFR